MVRKSTLGRVRKGKARPGAGGFIVTWDVDSSNQASASRVRRFIYGATARIDGRVYRYPGFVEKEGVRYLGQSVIFVGPHLLAEIDSFLSRNGVGHEMIPASLG